MRTKKQAQGFLLVLSALLVCFSLTACTSQEPAASSPYVSPYDWSCLSYQNDRFFYMKDGISAALTGIDVSEHQKLITWNEVAADGIDFALIRLGNRGYTEGEIYLDPYAYTNIEGARNAGILVGVYFFSQAINEQEAREEADIVLKALEGIPLDYPVFYDFEPINDSRGRANHISSAQLTSNAQVFCERIEEGGFVPGLYGNKRNVGRIDKELRERYGVWFAEYETKTPSAQFDFTIWQYSSSGVVAGIETRVDMNIHFLHP